MNREEIVEKIADLNVQTNQLNEQLSLIDYKQKLSEAKELEGKFFKEANRFEKKEEYNELQEYVRCAYIYDTDKERCWPMAITIDYYKHKESEWFHLDYSSTFNPKLYEEDRWVEITKEEFLHHYEQVQKRIQAATVNLFNK